MNEDDDFDEEIHEEYIETEWAEWEKTDDARRFREWQSDNKTIF